MMKKRVQNNLARIYLNLGTYSNPVLQHRIGLSHLSQSSTSGLQDGVMRHDRGSVKQRRRSAGIFSTNDDPKVLLLHYGDD